MDDEALANGAIRESIRSVAHLRSPAGWGPEFAIEGQRIAYSSTFRIVVEVDVDIASLRSIESATSRNRLSCVMKR